MRLRVATSVACIGLLVGGLGFGHADPAGATVGPAGTGWHLALDATFDGTSLDRSLWSTCYDWGCTNAGNDELEWYEPGRVQVQGGTVNLRALDVAGGGKPYTSGMIQSAHHFTFRYVYAEIDARVPTGPGLWSAFWMLPTSERPTPEIDIVEVYGTDPNAAVMTLHASDGGVVAQTFDGPDFAKGFHRFAVDWEPHSISWYVDGVQRQRVQASVNTPEYLLADLAINGTTPPTAETSFPAAMSIRSIKVWQRG
jgi:beta-glucanase (GH16 family)